MLHPLPDGVSDPVACLHEPVSIACHGLLRAPPPDGDPVLVVGAGIIGLASVAAIKGSSPGARSPCWPGTPTRPKRPPPAGPTMW